MPPEQNESSVDRIRKLLSARDAQSKIHARRKMQGKRFDVHQEWEEDSLTQFPHQSEAEIKERELEALREGRLPDSDPMAESMHRLQATRGARRQHVRKLLTERFMRTLLVASVAFFIISSVIAGYFLIFSNRQVSCNNVRVEVRGPTSLPSGKELVLNILVTNNNTVPLKNAEITLEYPEGARNKSGDPQSFQRDIIGIIESGEVAKHTGRAVLSGREQEQKTIQTLLTFGIDDSNASWTCTQSFVVTLATAPINLAVDALGEISSGQEMTLAIAVTANSDDTVPDARLVVKYPYGFKFLSADPKPTAGESVWDLGDVKPNTRQTITVRGVVNGFETEQRTISFELGEADPKDPALLSVVLQTMDHLFLMTRPFMETTLWFGEEAKPEGAYDVTPGSSIEGTLRWKNTLNEPLYDVEVKAVLPDEMIDRMTVKPGNGFFRSEINTMVWTSQTVPELKMIEPGKQGILNFSFQTASFVERTSANNPSFGITFEIRARRIADAIPVEEVIQDQAEREIRFMTNPIFVAKSVYGTGPFTNTGPHPPTADTETTYTVVWNLKNTINDVHDGQVIGELPINVRWLNNVSPSDEKVTFNPVSRKVVWDVGDIVAGAGYKLPQRQVMFQVAIIPSLTQIGSIPALVFGNDFTGVDSFTGTVIQRTFKEPVNTSVTGDPFFPNTPGFVRE
jgi:hypothetical protein